VKEGKDWGKSGDPVKILLPTDSAAQDFLYKQEIFQFSFQPAVFFLVTTTMARQNRRLISRRECDGRHVWMPFKQLVKPASLFVSRESFQSTCRGLLQDLLVTFKAALSRELGYPTKLVTDFGF